MKTTILVLASVLCVASAALPTPPTSFAAQVDTFINFDGGWTTRLTGVVDQIPNAYASNLEDETGNSLAEGYMISEKGCTNWEKIPGEANTCILGCQMGVSCDGHSCKCSAAQGLFKNLVHAVANGTCAGGQAFVSAHDIADDDAERDETTFYCFNGNTPLSKFKVYQPAALPEDVAADFPGLIPRHLTAGGPIKRIGSVLVEFARVQPGNVDPEVFRPSPGCVCKK